MWSSVGSAGIVDLADISKVFFEGPLAQLGRGISPPPGREAAIVGSTVTATIRYGVPPDSFGTLLEANVWALEVSFRQGDGRVIAELIEVDITTGVEANPLLLYDTAIPGFGSTNPQGFFVGQVDRDQGPQHPLNVSEKVYYVKLTLSHNDVIVERTPPAVAALLLVQANNG
jgi:hypothetical protein